MTPVTGPFNGLDTGIGLLQFFSGIAHAAIGAVITVTTNAGDICLLMA